VVRLYNLSIYVTNVARAESIKGLSEASKF